MSERVAIYCRLSEEDKNKQSPAEDSGSIQNQKAMLRDYADTMGWKIFDVYSDDDYAGSDRSRPQFNRLLADAQSRKFDIVLCKTQSRFTRELELVERYIHGLFPLWGIRFVSVVDNADTANKGNKKSRQINGLVNEWYLEDMSESIKAALDSRRKNGFHIGSFALYGYKKDPDNKGHLLVDEEAATVVREVFTLFSQGYGKTAIARILNDRGIPNPTEYKRLKGLRYKRPKNKNGTLWKYFAISDMLTNEIYIGNMVQGKYESVSYKTNVNRPRPQEKWYVVEGTHEPIVDRDLWNMVQKMVSERAKPFSGGTVGLFAKKARCACCGYTMRSSKSGGRRFLQCPSRHVAKESCEGAFISVDRLEQLVIAEINRLSAEYLDKDELEQSIEFCDNLQAQKYRILADLAACRKRNEEYSNALRGLYLDKSRGLITESDFLDLSRGFAEQREGLGNVISKGEKQLAEIEEKLVSGNNRRELVEQYTHLEYLTREIVETLIDYISVGKRIVGTRDVPVEIHWNF